MSARLFCDGCRTDGLDVVAGVSFDMPSGWVAVRLPNQAVEQHYCSANCLLDSFVLPGVRKFTDPDSVTLYGVAE